MNDSHTPDPRTLETSPVPRSKPVNPVRRLTLVVIAVGLVLFVCGMLSDRLTPFTSQATVQAYLVGIAPGISGKVSSRAAFTNAVKPFAQLS
jgi:multidrug resistance efflux pump